MTGQKIKEENGRAGNGGSGSAAPPGKTFPPPLLRVLRVAALSSLYFSQLLVPVFPCRASLAFSKSVITAVLPFRDLAKRIAA